VEFQTGMADFKEQKRAMAESSTPARVDLGVFNNEQSTSLMAQHQKPLDDDDDEPPPYPGVTPTPARSPIQSPWFKFKQKYFTKKNGLIAGGILLGLVAIFMLFHMFSNDEKKYLPYERISLGYFRNYNLRISFDENNNLVLLSRQLGSHLDVERFALDNRKNGFLHSQTQIESTTLKNCVQLADDVMCCDKTGTHSGIHCHLTQDGQLTESSAKFYHNFSSNWQSLDGGRKLLPVQNKHGFIILDLKENRHMRLDRSMLPPSHRPLFYFFSMDTYEELAELVNVNDEQLKICDYVPDNEHHYLLEDDHCRETNMTIFPEHNLIKFCDNPLYSAVLQYGNHEYDPEMKWVLQVKLEKEPEPYYVMGQDAAPLHQVAINCRDDSIDMYIPGRHELFQYTVLLPNELHE